MEEMQCLTLVSEAVIRTRCGGCHGSAIGRNLVVKPQSRVICRTVIKLKIGSGIVRR